MIQGRRDSTGENVADILQTFFMKTNSYCPFVHVVPTNWHDLNMLYNNVNKTILRIMTPMTVFLKVFGNFMFLIVTNFWES
jgi:hypothetical protein